MNHRDRRRQQQREQRGVGIDEHFYEGLKETGLNIFQASRAGFPGVRPIVDCIDPIHKL